MWKVLICVLVFAVPIFCAAIDGGEKKTAFQRTVEDMWKQKCKNVSGVDVDFERNERLHLEFKNCKKNAIDDSELRRDVLSIVPNFKSISNFTISDRQKTDLIAVSRKFCPKMDSFLRCSDVMLPIRSECYTEDEILAERVDRRIVQSASHFFCKNESVVGSFIDAKIIECGKEKKAEVDECLQDYSLQFHTMKTMLNLLPSPDKVCKSVETLKRCIVPLFEQCELSQIAGTFAKSFFADIQTETTCSNFSLANSNF